MENIFIHNTADVSEEANIGEGTKIWNLCQVRENTEIGKNCILSKNVYIDSGVKIGDNCKIQNNVSVYHGVEVRDGVFLGPHVCFTNDKIPRAVNPDGSLKLGSDWEVSKTIVGKGAAIGANSTITPGVNIGEWALVGAGAVVTKDVPDYGLVVGCPAKLVSYVCKCGDKITDYCEKCDTKLNEDKNKMIPIVKVIVGEEEKKKVLEVMDSGMLAQGSKVKELEEKYAEFCGVKHAIAVNSGTAALHCANYAVGVKRDDEVITIPFTFVASANPIIMQGAKPVFVDIKKDTFNIDPEEVRKKITDKTKAICAVNLYGQVADYDELKKIADEFNLKIIEDAAQSVGSELNGKRSGSLADIGCFSFYATKNMMTGEGGMITTDNDEYAELCRRFRHHGQSEQTRYEYYDLGYNYRMTDLCAAIGLAQLEKIEELNEKRINNAKRLIVGLKDVEGITVPYVKENVKHVFHQFSILVDGFKLNRDELREHLKQNDIGSAIFYPKPLHLHPHFARLGYNEGDFPVSESVAKKVLCLPIHPSLSDEDVDRIITVIKNCGGN